MKKKSKYYYYFLKFDIGIEGFEETNINHIKQFN